MSIYDEIENLMYEFDKLTLKEEKEDFYVTHKKYIEKIIRKTHIFRVDIVKTDCKNGDCGFMTKIVLPNKIVKNHVAYKDRGTCIMSVLYSIYQKTPELVYE